MASSLTRFFLDRTQRRTTVCRTPLGEWSARRKDLYLPTRNTHNRKTSMPPVGLEPTISAGERPQTYALERAATGTDSRLSYLNEMEDETCWVMVLYEEYTQTASGGSYAHTNTLSSKCTRWWSHLVQGYWSKSQRKLEEAYCSCVRKISY